MFELVVKYIHFIGITLAIATLFCQSYFIDQEVRLTRLRKLVAIDNINSFSLIGALLSGLLLWFFAFESITNYPNNLFFIFQLLLFFLVVILSVYTALFFFRARHSFDSHTDIPNTVISLIRVKMFVLLLLPLVDGLGAQIIVSAS